MPCSCTSDKINYYSKLYQRLIFSFPFTQNRAYILWIITLRLFWISPVPSTYTRVTQFVILSEFSTDWTHGCMHYPVPCHYVPLHHFLHFVSLFPCFTLNVPSSIHVDRWYISLHTLLNRNGTLGSSMLKAIRSSSTGLSHFLLL
jgi:hypothetical protein